MKELFAVYKHLMGECKEDGVRLCSEVCGDRTRSTCCEMGNSS